MRAFGAYAGITRDPAQVADTAPGLSAGNCPTGLEGSSRSPATTWCRPTREAIATPFQRPSRMVGHGVPALGQRRANQAHRSASAGSFISPAGAPRPAPARPVSKATAKGIRGRAGLPRCHVAARTTHAIALPLPPRMESLSAPRGCEPGCGGGADAATTARPDPRRLSAARGHRGAAARPESHPEGSSGISDVQDTCQTSERIVLPVAAGPNPGRAHRGPTR